MAAPKDTEISIWLQNKLGSSDDLWSSSSICAQLNKEKLGAIQDCFLSLSSTVKVKLMLSFLHLPKRILDECLEELEGILELAQSDLDQWVSVVASMLRQFPSSGNLSSDAPVLQETVAQLKKISDSNPDPGSLPMECRYLSRSALQSVLGPQLPPQKHFRLTRKPKSADLRNTLLQKSSEFAQNSKKPGTGHSIPVKFRSSAKKMDDNKPMSSLSGNSIGFLKSMPLARSFGGNTSNRAAIAAQREGGIKLLDISETPAQGREAKRRRKQGEMTAHKKDEQALELTPDYAAGLLPQINVPTTVAPQAPSGPTYVPPTSSAAISIQMPAKVGDDPPAIFVNPAGTVALNFVRPTTMASIVSMPTTSPVVMQQPPKMQIHPQPPPIQQIQTPRPVVSIVPQASTSNVVTPPVKVEPSGPSFQIQQAGQPRRNLTLTREQMFQAQELFKLANRVTRPEKALILGFMAGSRENPCPQQGELVNIRLSEHEDIIEQVDGTFRPMMVEMYFQMNFKSGEWKTIKKFRTLQQDG